MRAVLTTNANTPTLKHKLPNISGKILVWLFLIIVLVFTVFPVLMTILGSFKSNAELTAGATFLPNEWHFSNYVEAWQKANFAVFTWNSVYMSIMTTVFTLFFVSLATYVVDRTNFIGKSLFIGLQAATMFISIGAVVLRPQFELMIKLNLHTSLWGVIIILVGSHATTFFILLGFFRSIPKDLDESATIDGCSFFGVYWRIVLPLIKPGLGVAGLFAFRAAWNEYILPLVFTMTSPQLQTLTVGLANLRYGTQAAAETHLMMAGACLSIIPMLVVYLFANRSFMQMTEGSIKG